MHFPFGQTARVLLFEAFRHRKAIVIGFLAINVVAVGVAILWPASFVSSATIMVEQKNIIQPLMQGAAVTTDARDQARIAKEIVFSRRVMTAALEHTGLIKEKQTEIEQEKAIDTAKGRTRITNVGPNLIRIEYSDSDAERAFKMAKKYAELFMNESFGSQAQESEAAFEFIDKQVKEYHAKLMQAEEQLKEFRSKYIDARPGTEGDVTRRIDALQATIERTALELKEAKIKETSLEKQLSGEAEIAVNVTREGQYLSRIAELQAQLDNLRLTYHETYPDIVRLKHQIEDLKEGVGNLRKEREEARKSVKASNQNVVDEGVRFNPVYQQLKQQLFDARINIETLTTRLNENRSLLRTELDRATRVHGGEATLAELTRDYEVNRDIYQDLLRRRENARVSKSLDRDKQNLTLRMQEPAVLPVRPSGPRFGHIVIAGLLLSITLPVGVLYGAVRVDPRLRSLPDLALKQRFPVLAVVPHAWSPGEAQVLVREVNWALMAFGILVAALAAVGLLRTFQVI
jgi:polysaccharide chain length determinant protein (PEP-CTERM system associated)